MAPRVILEEIKIEDIDFDKVAQCDDKQVLKRYIALLEEDGSYFIDLLKACRERLREVSPKEYYLLYPRNASQEEVDQAMQDLLHWEDVVKETDAALRSSKKQDLIWDEPFLKVKQPIRGQEPAVVRPNLHREEQAHRQQSDKPRGERDVLARDKTKMKDYYAAWDKVDVDALEEELDKEEQDAEAARQRHFQELKEQQAAAQATTPMDLTDLPQEVPQAHKQHLASSEKEKGNEAFHSKDYEEAEAYYTRSLHYKADDPATWANRALARLKLKKPQAALEDCEHALALNGDYMKALHRKGKALHDLGRYEEAVRFFQLALMKSPGNSQINGDLMVARRRLRSEGPAPQLGSQHQGGAIGSTCRIEELPDDMPVSVPKPPGYTRVEIEEDSDSEDDSGGGRVAGVQVPPDGSRTTENLRRVVIEEVSDAEDMASEPASAAPKAATVCLDDMD